MTEGTCQTCAHFCNEAGYLEREFTGLAVMGSGRGSVRSADGVCRRHGVYLPATATCDKFEPVAPAL